MIIRVKEKESGKELKKKRTERENERERENKEEIKWLRLQIEKVQRHWGGSLLDHDSSVKVGYGLISMW